MSLRTVKRWFAKFSEGDYNIEDKPRSGRPSDLDLEALQADLENNSEQSTRQLSAKLSCSHSAVARGLRRAGYKNVKGGDVPHELTLDNKNRRIDCATELLTKRRTFAWLERLITGDESWVLYETPKVTRYWIPSSSDPPCRARAEAHQRKLCFASGGACVE
ncbi:hypothetical protein Q1695_004178 [Nippostrongylus brasiliensis]|nr:hypothetical protein Q1695_004178 [Nippostrongylus brasiliensis]